MLAKVSNDCSTRGSLDRGRFLTQPEIKALLVAPDRNTWLGRRDHALLLTEVQTGLRLSELTSLRQSVTDRILFP
jgi:integrase